MYGSTISRILSSDEWSGEVFHGLTCKDVLPRLTGKETFPLLYIYNSAYSHEPGEHWVVIYFSSKSNVEFFDSLAQSVSWYGLTRYFRKRGVKRIDFNNSPVQHFGSQACGYHALFYSLLRCRGYKMKEILSKCYSDNLYKNDQTVTQIIKSLFEVR